jgi:hypothetical protein
VVGWNVHTSGSSGWEDHIGDLVQSLRLMLRGGEMEQWSEGGRKGRRVSPFLLLWEGPHFINSLITQLYCRLNLGVSFRPAVNLTTQLNHDFAALLGSDVSSPK